ncbi:hypothetical protein HaLaN_07876 [Haematococcus lacustris]|uniref:Uncharacterized protein n=1 Tax=Haematococcus lacustris TaxID=44745 RepID=A0A699YZP8_HAELA|nr:hypothetical protein HaLaN_07876 [Haematococcus lacustris]
MAYCAVLRGCLFSANFATDATERLATLLLARLTGKDLLAQSFMVLPEPAVHGGRGCNASVTTCHAWRQRISSMHDLDWSVQMKQGSFHHPEHDLPFTEPCMRQM